MAQLSAPHPQVQHTSAGLTPAEALQDISAYLTAAASDASLHPNALLTESGPAAISQGEASFGIALHNLRRLQAGLRGEKLVADPDVIGLQTSGAFGADGTVEDVGVEERGGGGQMGGGSGGGRQNKKDGISEQDGQNRAGAAAGMAAPPDPTKPTKTADAMDAMDAMDSEWQDLEEFEREQDVEQAPAEGTEALVVREDVGDRTGKRKKDANISYDYEKQNGKQNGHGNGATRAPQVEDTGAQANGGLEGGENEAERKAMRKKLKKERNKEEKRAKAEKHNSKKTEQET